MKINNLINQKAQSILELATFGSVVLFCLALLIHFGLQMNYQQNTQMQAFRKTLKLAYYKQGPNSQAGLTVIKDKPAVDPRDKWGFADRVSAGGGAAITWSNTLNGVYVNDITGDVDDRDYPRTYIEINKEAGGMGLNNNEINNNLEKNRVGTQAKGAFVTSKPMRVGGVQNLWRIGTYIEDSQHKYGTRDYFPLLLDPKTEIKVFQDAQDPQQKSAQYMYNGLKRTLESVVLISSSSSAEYNKFMNGASRPYALIAVKGELGRYGSDCICDYPDDPNKHPNKSDCPDNLCEPPDNYCGKPTEILTMVSQLGEIDTAYTDIKPWDKNNPYDPKTLSQKQGLLMDSVKKVDYGTGASITTTETSTGISTTTQSSATQTVTHKIRLNNGTVTEVPAVFKPDPVKQSYNYEVKHE